MSTQQTKKFSKMGKNAFAALCATKGVPYEAGTPRAPAIAALIVLESKPPAVQPVVQAAAQVAEVEAPRVKRGRKPLSETMTAEEIQAEIAELLTDLKNATAKNAKKRIRRALRLRGHMGGLGLTEDASEELAELDDNTDDE